jgi:glycerophosphoryl diester phosphodiesterase
VERGRRRFILGHLGNTLEALDLVRASGVDGVEFDVRRCEDGALVLHHDAVIEGLGAITRLSRDRLPASLPLLEDALETCEGLIVNIEVKNLPIDPDTDPTEQLAMDVANMVTGRGLEESVIVSSFTGSALDAVRACNRRIRTGQLTLRSWNEIALLEEASAKGHSALHPHRKGVTPGLVDLAHSRQMWIVPWAVDTAEDIAGATAEGVDGLITDDPELAVTLLGRDSGPGAPLGSQT